MNTSTKGQKIKLRSRVKMNMKAMYFVLSSSVIFLSLGIVSVIFFSNSRNAVAATLGDYRAVATGNWNATTTWETFDGTSWVAASLTPKSTDGAITVQAPFTVTVTANVTVDELTVQSGAAISISSSKTLTVADKAASTDYVSDGDLTIFGTLNMQGNSSMTLGGLVILKNGGVNTFNGGATLTINNGGRYRREDASFTIGSNNLTVNSGGVYQHNIDGQTIPTSNWNAGSTCEITGIIGTKPNINNSEVFYNVIWNSPSQTVAANLTGDLDAITNDITFISTGSGSVRLGQPENYNMTVGGNFNMQGGTVFASTTSQSCTIDITGDFNLTGGTFAGSDATKNAGDASPTMTVNGNFNISNGTFDFSQYTGNTASKGVTSLNLKGDLIQSGGTLTETATQNGHGEVYFAKSGSQTFSKTSGTISNTVNFTVNNNAALDMGTSIFTGGGTFDVLSGGEIKIGSTTGIAASTATGNIQVTGTRTFNAGGFYTYNGGAAQITGDGLPATSAKLTINNSNDVTLTATTNISNTLTLTSGDLLAAADTLILGTSTANLGTLSYTSGSVIGNFKRWFTNATVNNVVFPIGIQGYYQGVNISYTGAPTAGGTLYATYTATDPGTNGFNLIESGDTIKNIGFGLWQTQTGKGLTGGTFSIDITATGMPSVADYTKLHMLRRANSAAAWTLAGTHAAGTGSNAVPVVHRTSLTTHAQFGIGGGTTNPLPIELIYFRANLVDQIVKLTWETASETNNDYFTVERSADGINYSEVLKKDGAGNTTHKINYSAEDPHPLNGGSYYRLRQTDYDGHSTFSNVVTINFSGKPGDNDEIQIISVAPNPFTDNFTINFLSKGNSQVDIMLVNSSGQTVIKDKIQANEGTNTYQFSNKYNINRGIYFVYMICNDQKVIKKIINDY